MASTVERDENESKVDQLFSTPRGVKMSPSPFLKGQTMARIRELEKQEQARRGVAGLALSLRFLPKWGYGAMATAAIAAAWFLSPGRASFSAPIGKEMVVLVQEDGSKYARVSAVQVELPSGVKFHSEEFPELADQAVLTLPWKASNNPDEALPVVIQSGETGLKRIKIRYLDSDQREIETREMKVRFREPTGEEKRI